MGNALTIHKRYNEALAAYERAISLDPEDGRLQYNIGMLHWQMERPADAERRLLACHQVGTRSGGEVVAGPGSRDVGKAIEAKEARRSERERDPSDRILR